MNNLIEHEVSINFDSQTLVWSSMEVFAYK